MQRRTLILLLRVLAVWASLLLTACNGAGLDSPRDRGCYTLQELAQMPEASLLPPQSEIVAHYAADNSGALEASYHGGINVHVGSKLDREAVSTFYHDRLAAWGWRVAATYPENVLWEKAQHNPLTVELWLLGPDDMGYLEEAARRKPYRTWFIYTFAEFKGNGEYRCPP